MIRSELKMDQKSPRSARNSIKTKLFGQQMPQCKSQLLPCLFVFEPFLSNTTLFFFMFLQINSVSVRRLNSAFLGPTLNEELSACLRWTETALCCAVCFSCLLYDVYAHRLVEVKGKLQRMSLSLTHHYMFLYVGSWLFGI